MLTRNAKRKLDADKRNRDVIDIAIDIETGLYKVDIDFDEASTLWKSNKKSIGNGSYQYICEKVLSVNRKCNKTACVGSPFCQMHICQMNKKEENITYKISEMV